MCHVSVPTTLKDIGGITMTSFTSIIQEKDLKDLILKPAMIKEFKVVRKSTKSELYACLELFMINKGVISRK